jgi:hypothetical protein
VRTHRSVLANGHIGESCCERGAALSLYSPILGTLALTVSALPNVLPAGPQVPATPTSQVDNCPARRPRERWSQQVLRAILISQHSLTRLCITASSLQAQTGLHPTAITSSRRQTRSRKLNSSYDTNPASLADFSSLTRRSRCSLDESAILRGSFTPALSTIEGILHHSTYRVIDDILLC